MNEQKDNQQSQDEQLVSEQETGLEKGAKNAVETGIETGKKVAQDQGKKLLLKWIPVIAPAVGGALVVLLVVITVFVMIMSLINLVGDVVNSIGNGMTDEFSVLTINENGISIANEDEIMEQVKEQLKASRTKNNRFRIRR